MTASPVKFTAAAIEGYNVERRTDARSLGTVVQRTEHYNLARPVTARYWVAYGTDGKLLRSGYGERRTFSTRAEAGQALLDEVSVRIAEPAPSTEPVDSPAEHLSAEGDRVEWISADDAVLVSAPSLTGSSTVRPLGADDALGRVYPAQGGTGYTALPATHECSTCPSVGSTLCDEDGVSITYPTRGEAARAIFAHLRALEVEVDDECDECGEPRDLGDDGELLDCQTCAEAIRPVHLMSADLLPSCGSTGDATGVSVAPWTTPERITCPACRPLIDAAREADYAEQEAETHRIEELCSVAAWAHEVAMSAKGRGKGAAFAARADALDALRVAALPEEATNVDALDLALGGTTVEAIENRYLALQGERLADELSEGAVVRFRPGAMPSCEGVNFLVDGPVRYDNSRGGRPYVWLRDDADGTRSAYLDALVLVTPAEATL